MSESEIIKINASQGWIRCTEENYPDPQLEEYIIIADWYEEENRWVFYRWGECTFEWNVLCRHEAYWRELNRPIRNKEDLVMRTRKIDYKVNDWVETCHMLPGIVQKINESLRGVKIYYPNYALKSGNDYKGTSECSIDSYGVHKIEPEYARKLFAIGEEKLTDLWNTNLDEIYQKKEEEQKDKKVKRPIDVSEDWKALVEKAYDSLEDKSNGEDVFKIGEEYRNKE